MLFFQYVQGVYKIISQLLETERRLGEAKKEVASLNKLQMTASTCIWAVESMHKNVEAGLKTNERQVKKAVDDLQASQDANVRLRIEVDDLKAELSAAQALAKKADEDK